MFSGIGGVSLGLHWAGFRTLAFCETDEFCQRLLARHWPGIPIYPDIRALDGECLQRDGISPFLVAGGFPCQDISLAGTHAGLDGPRSGLWREMARIVGACRPRWVIVENVPSLRTRGADQVIGDLAALDYASWAFVVGAVHAGAPHRRNRLFLLARDISAHPARARLEVRQRVTTRRARLLPAERFGGWPAEPCVRRVDDGFPGRVDRVRSLGNAVVPAIAAAFGRSINVVEDLERQTRDWRSGE
ncbi:MAG: DNA cytosine methyltransferase [Acetobacteraceae bacterium]|nr:DNA cytosine methyltransferase [Acetobacteraceae bacterium]